MPALLLTGAIVAIWILQGFGFVRWLVPTARERPALVLVLAAWFGLIFNMLLLSALYFLVPYWTIGQLAAPVTVVLAMASVALAATRAPRPRIQLDVASIVIGVCVVVAVVLVLRPLVDQSSLGFYESFNGEFAHYAVMADVAQFHDAAISNGGFAMQSREGMAGVACAAVCTITRTPAIWAVEPYAAALAAVAFASIGVLIQQILRKRQAGRAATVIATVIYVSAIWSAATSYSWTLSFISQYLSIAIWFPTLLFLAERPHNDRITTICLGLALGAMACAYPEMFAPNVALLAAFQFARAERGTRLRAIATFALALVLAFVVAHRFGYELLRKSSSVGLAGWNVYDGHRPLMRFLANVLGFATPHRAPATYNMFAIVIALSGYAVSLAYGAIRVWREREPTLRGLFCLGCLFYAGLAVAFVIVTKRSPWNNYVAAKVLLGFGCLGHVMLALAAIDLVRWRPKLASIVLVLALVVFAGLARGAWRFAKIQHRAPLYLESEGEALRKQLRGRWPYVLATQYSTEIIGRFMIHDRDIFAADAKWPGFPGLFVPGGPVLLIADAQLSESKAVTGNYLPAWWRGRLVLFEAR